MAARWRPTRHFTSQAQTSVASSAIAKAGSEKLASKPGAWRSTLAAGCRGNPVCMATQMIQIMSPQPVKNSSVNQSIKEATLRCKVGNANAAKVASGGKASNRARSAGRVVKAATTATPANHSGSARCRLTLRLKTCSRQRHKVHNTNGQAGQVNHNSKRLRVSQFLLPASWGSRMRQCQPSTADARAAASSVTSAIVLAARCAVRRPPVCGSAPSRCSNTLPAPKKTAIEGAPLRTSPAMPMVIAIVGATTRQAIAATAKKVSAPKHSCARLVVTSCDNCARPRQAIKASRPPSAIARA